MPYQHSEGFQPEVLTWPWQQKPFLSLEQDVPGSVQHLAQAPCSCKRGSC